MKNDELARLVEAVQANVKYRPISAELVQRVGAQELAKGRGWKEAVKATRNKLHQVGGAYQEGGIDYSTGIAELERLPNDLHDPRVMEFCRGMMQQHASTRERLPILENFFAQTLGGSGPYASVLDVACGLNPLALAWMPVAAGVRYFACDIYEDLVAFLTLFFHHFGIRGEAAVCDLTQAIPGEKVDLALVLKTLPCLAQIDKTIGPRLLDTIQADRLLVSFPAKSLGGRAKGMPEFYETNFREQVEGRGWKIERFSFQSELAFLVKKQQG